MGKRKKIFKRACKDVRAQIGALRELATDHHITIRLNEVRCGRKIRTYHVIFENDTGQVLHYWPGTGRVWCPSTGEKWLVQDCWSALDEAARIAAQMVGW
jgi:hypothetical protein